MATTWYGAGAGTALHLYAKNIFIVPYCGPFPRNSLLLLHGICGWGERGNEEEKERRARNQTPESETVNPIRVETGKTDGMNEGP